MATVQQATVRRDTRTTTMAMGDDNDDNDNGDGATGDKVDDDGNNDDYGVGQLQ
jgi:hypothetical protein